MLVDRLPEYIYGVPVLGIDIETTVTNKKKTANPWQDRMLSVQVSDGEQAFVLRDHFEQLVPILTNPKQTKIAHNARFDLAFLNHKLGIITTNVWDTLVVERLLYAGDRTRSNALANVLLRRLGVNKDEAVRLSFFEHSGDFTARQLEYMEKDVLYLPEIRRQQMEDISNQGIGRIVGIENRLVRVTTHMYLEGVGFDLNLWDEYTQVIERTLRQRVAHMAKYLNVPLQTTLFGDEATPIVNLNSTAQRQWLLETFGIQVETTQAPELEAVLDHLESTLRSPDEDPRVIFLRDYLDWANWNTMWKLDYPSHINPVTGRIHPDWNQNGPGTGRYSCKDPNLQNVRARPVEGEPDIRRLFLPQSKPGPTLAEEQYIFTVSDYAQQEPRVMAQICGDPNLIRACNEEDVYIAFGELTLGRKITKAERQMFKQGVLAAGYGGGVNKLRQVLNVSEAQAREFYNNLRQTFPGMFAWGDQQGPKVMRYGYASTRWGRRRWWPNRTQMEDWKIGREARNMPIQGTAADMMKYAMVLLYEQWIEPDQPDAAIALQIHDELVVRTNREIEDFAAYQVTAAMEQAGQEICPDVKTIAETDLMHRWSKDENYRRDRVAAALAG